MIQKDFKSKKELYGWLRGIANNLPLQGYRTKEKHLVPGIEANALTAGTESNPFGDRYNNDGLYKEKYPVINTVNHFNRLKTAYKNGGLQAVSDYVLKVGESISNT